MEPLDLVLLYSGGKDSRVLLEMALELGHSPYCVLVHYGQKHVKELEVATDVCIKKNIPYEIAGLEVATNLSMLTSNWGEPRYVGVSQWYVPSRNLILVGIAACIAESMNISRIWYGASMEDKKNRFPDCSQEWVAQVNVVLGINGSTPLLLEAPLLGMNQEMVNAFAKKYKIVDEEVFSGYGQE